MNLRQVQAQALIDFRRVVEKSKKLAEIGPEAIRRIGEGSEADGYSSGRSDVPGVSGGGVSDPTLAQVMAKSRDDKVLKNALFCAHVTGKILDLLEVAIGSAATAQKEGPNTVGERANETPACLVCGESTSGGWSGYCQPCAQAWNRYRRSHPNDHEGFRIWRRRSLEQSHSQRSKEAHDRDSVKETP